MTTLHIDFETRSELELRDVGLHNYARHPSTDVWCMAWAVDEDEPQLWTPGRTDYPRKHALDGVKVVAHNAAFELEIWNEIMAKRYGWPVLKPEQTYCTMAQCYAMGLPGALEDAALALGLHMLKDMEGRSLMLRYARPWKLNPTRWMDECPEFTVGGVKYTGAQGLERLREYCKQDVRVERELEKRLMPLSDRERKIFLLDYKINQRGVQVDVESAKAAITLANTVKEQCNAELSSITNGAVTAVTAVAALKEWIAAQPGVGQQLAERVTDGLAKQDVIDLLADESESLPGAVRRALVLRQEASKASTAKFDVMVQRVGADGRLRQMYQYHGAATGRWTGRGVQTHNLPRDMPKAAEVEKILKHVRDGNKDAIDLLYGPPLTTISRCLRSFFLAPPGKVLVSGDWSNIEGRGQAWFAGEDWKLDAFRAADAGTGPGIYELAYSRMFGVPVESVKDPSEERQVGKVSELAFGYQGGVGSFRTMGRNYNVKVSDAKADEFKRAWRAAHPKIVAVWREIQDAAIAAVENPNKVFTAGHHARQAKFRTAGSFLWCLLPSGRAICFPYPKILEGMYGPQLTYMTQPSPEDKAKGKVVADKMNTSNWVRIGTYGGSLFNNIVQGFCRDFLADGMIVLDEKGAAIVLHTHDDINLEVDEAKAERARDAMRQIMLQPPAWARGFPLKAKPTIMRRYGKS